MNCIFSTLALIILTATSVVAQTNQKGFLVKGTLDPVIKADSVFLFNGFEDEIAKAPVVNGRFELAGSVTEPQNATVYAKVDGELRNGGNLILENTNYTYTREGNYIEIKGGKLHDQVLGFESSEAYHHAVEDYQNTMRAIFDGKGEGYEPTADESAKMRDKMDKGIAIENRALESVIEGSNSPVLAKVFALGRTQDWGNYPSEKRVELFNFYEKELSHPSQELTNLRNNYLEAIEEEKMAKTVSVGSMFKDIQGVDMSETSVKLSDVIAKNKFTVLDFWASWCAPCRAEIPNLKNAYDKYKEQGLEIYSISIDEDTAKWLTALAEENTKWVQVLDNANAAKEYGVSAIPAIFLINQAGEIVATSEELHGSNLDKTLSKHIN